MARPGLLCAGVQGESMQVCRCMAPGRTRTRPRWCPAIRVHGALFARPELSPTLRTARQVRRWGELAPPRKKRAAQLQT